MINNWLKPSVFNEKGNITLHSNVHLFEENTDLRHYDLAILGYTCDIADPLRSVYFTFSSSHNECNIIDLGNLINPNYTALKSIYEEMANLDITIIVLGLPNDTIQSFNALIHEINSNNNSILLADGRNVGQLLASNSFSLCGIQSHLINPKTFESIHANHIRHRKLGDLKKNTSECEPLIRDASHVFLDTSVIKYQDAPCQPNFGSSGLTSEELCQIMHYAGFNVKCRLIAFCDMVDIKNDPISLNTVSQAIWYFINAHGSRKSRLNSHKNTLIEYLVDLTQLESPLRFKHDTNSGEWWLCHIETEGIEKWMACGVEDYNLALENIIPPRLNFRITD